MKISTKEDYDIAMNRVKKLIDKFGDKEPSKSESKELDKLVDAIVVYENEHYPF
ncbi:hypothetical protein [Pseudoalteromonas umbrosa]|uniref:hypothetical protein n=1 Tax=Pseudoalteromonas umbrosa TaxID=3048489 RepID=UPI0024C2EE24|nr:hypothetical protein [Pseudoalteromonas sp. B95]MDK1288531.1 hypothetical protein [Pseudoalteromonas sp. B95]